MITIEPFKPEYRDAFRDLNLEWIRTYFKVEPKDLEQTNSPEACIREGGHILFAVEDGEVLGTCALYKIHGDVPEGENDLELAKMAVRPDARGRGFGDLLMLSAEKWARVAGANRIMILSNTVLEPAIALYIKHGYQIKNLGPHKDYERCNIEMWKSI